MNQIRENSERYLWRTQHDIRNHKSCTDLTNVLRIIIEQPLEWIFIDFIKALDLVNRNMEETRTNWNAHQNYQIN